MTSTTPILPYKYLKNIKDNIKKLQYITKNPKFYSKSSSTFFSTPGSLSLSRQLLPSSFPSPMDNDLAMAKNCYPRLPFPTQQWSCRGQQRFKQIFKDEKPPHSSFILFTQLPSGSLELTYHNKHQIAQLKVQLWSLREDYIHVYTSCLGGQRQY